MQEVLICPECKKDKDGSFKKATAPSALIPHSPASASAVAYAMFHKCFMGLPYYRQESLFDQSGAKIPRETLANWCIITSRDYLYPIYELLHNELLHRDIIHAVSRPWTTVISTEEEPLARMLASGNFYPDAVLKIQRTDLVPEKISGYRTIDSLFYEIWQNSDSLYQEESVLRILAKDYSQQAVVGILSEGGIQLVDCRRDGDYLVFSGPGSGNLIILEPVRIHAIWIGAVGILVIIWFLWKKESKQNKVKE